MRILTMFCLLVSMVSPVLAEKAYFIKNGKMCGTRLKAKSFKEACGQKNTEVNAYFNVKKSVSKEMVESVLSTPGK